LTQHDRSDDVRYHMGVNVQITEHVSNGYALRWHL